MPILAMPEPHPTPEKKELTVNEKIKEIINDLKLTNSDYSNTSTFTSDKPTVLQMLNQLSITDTQYEEIKEINENKNLTNDEKYIKIEGQILTWYINNKVH